MSLWSELIIPRIKVELSPFQAECPSVIWFVCWWRLNTKGILLMLGCTNTLVVPRSAVSSHPPPAPTLQQDHMWSAIQGASKGHQPKQDMALSSQTSQSGGSLPCLTNHSPDQYGGGLYCVRKQPLSAPRQSRLNSPRGPVLDYHVCSAHNHCIMKIRLDWLEQREKKRRLWAFKPSRHLCVVLKTVIIPVISPRLVGNSRFLLTQTQNLMVPRLSNNSRTHCVVSVLFLQFVQKCLCMQRTEEPLHRCPCTMLVGRYFLCALNFIEATLFICFHV